MQADGGVAKRTRAERVAQLFEKALRLSPGQRHAFLDRACSSDSGLRADLESMLETESLAPVPASLPKGREIAGRFRIERFIGHGGMGDVYAATDIELRSPVALKTVRSELVRDPQVLSRFKREILLSKQITHPNVCRVYDLGIDRPPEAEPMLFLTMQLLEGETLSACIKRGPMPPSTVIPLIEDMAGALSAAHQTGIVHRDFKSGNVMLAESLGRPRAIVTDFGLARSMSAGDATVTDSRVTAGTPAYMAPEQVRGEPATAAADIYALGIVIFEMLTGRCPFTGESAMAIAVKHLNEQPPAPRTLAPHLDPRWDDLILRCLRKKPEERFPSAQAVAAAAAAIGSTLAPARSPMLRRPMWWLAVPVLLIAAGIGGWMLRAPKPRARTAQPAPTIPASAPPSAVPPPAVAKAISPPAVRTEPKLPPIRPIPRDYTGALRGAVQWSGRLAPRQTLTIQGGGASSGSLSGSLPCVPVTIEVPTPYALVAEPPAERNHWDRIVLRNDSPHEPIDGIVIRWTVTTGTEPGPKLPPVRAVDTSYTGTLRGMLQWSGRLAPHQTLTIQAGKVLAGTLKGDLPRVPVTLEILTPFILAGEAPNDQNHYDRIVLRNDSASDTVEGIVIRWSVIR